MTEPMVFEIEADEVPAVKAFLEEHAHRGEYHGAIGGHISYTFCSTSIGMVITVKCDACGASHYASGLL